MYWFLPFTTGSAVNFHLQIVLILDQTKVIDDIEAQILEFMTTVKKNFNIKQYKVCYF